MNLDTAEGTARIAKASPFVIRRLGAKGVIKVYRLGRSVRYDTEEVLELMRKEGLSFLRDEALRLASEGVTSPEQAFTALYL